jgi:hypothetical protein
MAATALGGMDRNQIGAGLVASANESIDVQFPRSFAMYETTLDLDALALSGRLLESVTFNDVNAEHSVTGIFAIDGTPVPEPSTSSMIVVFCLVVWVGRRGRAGIRKRINIRSLTHS